MPSYFSDGDTGRRQDSKWRILEKIVSAAYATGPQTGTYPTRRDTRRMLYRKWNAIRAGKPI